MLTYQIGQEKNNFFFNFKNIFKIFYIKFGITFFNSKKYIFFICRRNSFDTSIVLEVN